MARLEVPPTKTSLRRIKENLAFAYEGFDLLNRKREILVMEIMRNVKTIQKIESQFRRSLEELYHSYRVAAVEMGSSALTMKSCSEKRGYYLRTYTSRLMGLSLTGFQVKTKKMRQLTGFAGTTAAYDEAREKCLGLLSLVADYATATKSVIMLSRELRKVQRRVNALEKLYIPRNEEAKKYISDRIEEMEREEVFIKKLLAQRSIHV